MSASQQSPEKAPWRCRLFGHHFEGVWLFTPNVIVQECAHCDVRKPPASTEVR